MILDSKGWDSFRIGKQNDKRRKLSQEDKDRIKHLYHIEKQGVRQIARSFDGICSRRAIQFLLFPERLAQNRERLKERGGWRKYYTTEKRREHMRNYRNHIREIIKNK